MRNTDDICTYSIKEMSKVMSIIRDLALVINGTQIDTFQLIMMSSYKTGYPVRTNLFVYDLLGEIFHDLGGWRKTSVAQLINVHNKSFFLYVRKVFACLRGCFLTRGSFASKAL